MNKQKSFIFLFLIVLIASVIRLWKLGSIPASPDWDEAALGYNAYSILKTGRDEYGVKFPLVLRSFDDYKPPLYAYLTIPSVAIFGLNTQSVRLPSAVLGIIAVIGAYFLTKELFKKSPYSDHLSLIASFLLAISPWHIQFSRIAFEASIGVALNIWGACLFLKGLKNTKFLYFSAVVFGLSLYEYHSERIFVPALVLVLAVLYRRELAQIRKEVYKGAIVGLVVVAPLLTVLLNPQNWMRLRGTSITADRTPLLEKSVERLKSDKASGNTIGMIFDNRRIVYVKKFLDGYFAHTSLNWLFLEGDNARHHAPDVGLLYFIELPLVFWGVIRLVKENTKVKRFIFSWLIISPLAAAFTTGVPHAIRTLVVLPIPIIFVSLGIIGFLEYAQKLRKTRRFIIYCVFLGSYIFCIIHYFHMYFIHTNREFSEFWQYGYKEAVRLAEENKSKYEKVVVSTSLEQPHIFFLFYTKYDPKKYLEEGGTSSGGFAESRNRFDKYEFRAFTWDKETHDGSTLYIGKPSEVHGGLLHIIFYLNGKEAIRIAE